VGNAERYRRLGFSPRNSNVCSVVQGDQSRVFRLEKFVSMRIMHFDNEVMFPAFVAMRNNININNRFKSVWPNEPAADQYNRLIACRR
jgi:hypothetical protein